MLFDLSANSNAVKLMDLDPNYPQDVTITVPAGETASVEFQVAAADPDRVYNASYQWYVNGEAVSGATAQTYTRDVTYDRGLYSVWCDVIQRTGTTRSRNANLEVKKPAVLSDTAPADAEAQIGQETSFSVEITEAGYPDNYSYQWYLDGSAVSGATASTFTTSPAVGSHSIYCIVTNEAGSVKSRVVTLTVNRVDVVIDGNLQNGGSWGAHVEDEISFVRQESGCLIVYCDGARTARAWSSNKFDFTGKNKLIFYVQHFSNTSGSENNKGTIYFGACDTLNDNNFVAQASVQGHNGNGEYVSVDVTHLSGSHYIKICIVRDVSHADAVYVEDVYFE